MAYLCQADNQVKLAISGEEEDVTMSTIIEFAFCTYYTFEVFLRLVVLRRNLLSSASNTC